MPEQSQPEPRRGREGGKWVNERPTSEEFATWFSTNMKLDPALKHEDYVGGLVLIPGVDNKAKQVTGFAKNGHPIIEERPELSYTPYAKVDCRVNYFWDLLEVHPEWVGVVENVALPRMPIDQASVVEHETTTEGETQRVIDRSKVQPGGLATMTYQLPEGFSVMSIPVKDGYTHFLCATIRVSIYLRSDFDAALAIVGGNVQGALARKMALDMCAPLRTGRGTKQCPFLTGYRDNPWADPNLVMKAETSALGRALGAAGVFVIPGSGVATAEDVLEANAQGAPPIDAAVPGNAGPDAPVQPPVRTGAERAVEDEAALHARANALWRALSEHHTPQAETFGRWAKERHLGSLGEAQGAALRGAVKKLERLTDEANSTVHNAEPVASPVVGGRSDA